MHKQTVHLIDDDPELFMGCAAGELKYIALLSLAGSVTLWFLLFSLFGWYRVLAMVPAIFTTALVSWRLALWLGKKKRGKPSRYHLQWLKIHWLPGKPPYHLHKGSYRIGRTH